MAKRRRAEVKLKEDVSPNVIPMVDIMFLLVLFFMLAADMSQRDLEIVELPFAGSAQNEKEEEKLESVKEKRPTINVYHPASGSCAAYAGGGVCREEGHWFYTLKGAHYNFNLEDVDKLKEGTIRRMEEQLREIRVEWDNENGRQNDPATPLKPSEMPLMIRGDRSAPYGYIQRILGVAGKLFIYKTSVGASLEEAVPTK